MGQGRSSLGTLRLHNTSKALSKLTVCCDQNKKIKYVAACIQALRPYMEDARATILDQDGSRSTLFFGANDGHGGANIAQYCPNRFHTELLKDEEYHNNLNYFRMGKQSQEHDEWKALANPPLVNLLSRLKTVACAQGTPKVEGSTASVSLIRGYQINGGSVGDSRCVLSRNGQAMDLSTDHKPNLLDESWRIENAGGRVTRDALIFRCLGQAGIPLGGYHVNGMLPMFTAIGDLYFQSNKDYPPAGQMLPCGSNVCTADITHGTEFLRIASDSIWDTMSRQRVDDCVYKKSENKPDNANDVGISLRNGNHAPRTPWVKKYATTNSWPSNGMLGARLLFSTKNHAPRTPWMKKHTTDNSCPSNGMLGARHLFSTKAKYVPSTESNPENTIVVCLDDPLQDFRESYIGGVGEISKLCYNNGKRIDISKINDGQPEMFTTPSSGYFWLKLVFGQRHLLFPVIAKSLYILGWKGGKGGAFVTKDNDDMAGYNLLENAKELSFSESYCDMVGDLAAVPIGPDAIREAFNTLYSFCGHGHKDVRRALGIIVVNFCEAARFRRISRSTSASFSSDSFASVLGEENSKRVRNYGSICTDSMKDIDTCLTKKQPVKDSTSEALAEIRIFNRSGHDEGVFKYEDEKSARSRYQRSRTPVPTFVLNEWFSSEELMKRNNSN